MSTDGTNGIFSLCVQSAQWQLKHLFDEVGGEYAIRALDELSTLPVAVQQNLLSSFEKVIKEVKSGALKMQTAADEKNELEESLVSELTEDLNKARFAVIDGGKGKSRSNRVINFPNVKRAVAKDEHDGKLIA